MSILNPLKSRGKRFFNQVEIVAEAISQATDYLEKAAEKMHGFSGHRSSSFEDHQEITRGLDGAGQRLHDLSTLLENLTADLRDYEQTQVLLDTNLGDAMFRFKVMLGKWQETDQITREMLKDASTLVTLLNNLTVFFQDPAELAAILSQVDEPVLQDALKRINFTT